MKLQQEQPEAEVGFLVPVALACDEAREPDGTCPRIKLQSVSWGLLEASSGRLCASFSRNLQESALAEVLKELEESLQGKPSRLVCCGPNALRQQLHPASLQAELELSDLFASYVDLNKEFLRRYGSCRREPLATGSAMEEEEQQVSPLAAAGNFYQEELYFCYCGCPLSPADFYNNSGGNLQQPANCLLATSQSSSPAGQDQRNSSSRQLEEMLKFGAISEPAEEPECEACQQLHKDQLEGNGSQNEEAEVDSESRSCGECSKLRTNRQLQAMSRLIERMLNEGHQFSRLELIKRRVEVGLCESSGLQDNDQRVVRARGLPWQATEQDIANFFAGLNIAKGGVGLCLSRQGRRNGEALIQFESREHRNLALARHKHYMGSRYIEVYRASGEDFLGVAAGYNNKAQAFLSRGAQVIVRMRGLPFTCSAQQVIDFFASSPQATSGGSQKAGCEILGGEEGILFVRNQEDKPTGDAFVLFAKEEIAQRALAKHRQNIGARYVELFRSSISEVQQVLSISMEPGPLPLPAASGRAQPAGTGSGTPAQQAPASQALASGRQRSAWRQAPITYAQVATCKNLPEPAPATSGSDNCDSRPDTLQSSEELKVSETLKIPLLEETNAAELTKPESNSSSSSTSADTGCCPSEAGNSLNSEATSTGAATSGGGEQRLSASNSAQSPVSTLSAASNSSSSAGSSSYKSSHYSHNPARQANNYHYQSNRHHHHHHNYRSHHNHQSYQQQQQLLMQAGSGIQQHYAYHQGQPASYQPAYQQGSRPAYQQPMAAMVSPYANAYLGNQQQLVQVLYQPGPYPLEAGGQPGYAACYQPPMEQQTGSATSTASSTSEPLAAPDSATGSASNQQKLVAAAAAAAATNMVPAYYPTIQFYYYPQQMLAAPSYQ